MGGSSNGAKPSGTILLTSGSYTSTAATLNNGGAAITIPAGVLAIGTDALKATYTPDAASSILFNTASGTGTVTVAQVVAITPNPATVTIGNTQQFAATVTGTGGVDTVTWAVA